MKRYLRRDCAFCGSPGPLTKEDAWPRWLNTHLPKRPAGVALDLTLRSNDVVRESRRTVTSYNTARVPGFCKKCNNGWMSELEKRAAPVLLPMIRGERVVLNKDQQLVVATWVAKTALVFDQRALGRQPFVSTDLAHQFGADRMPIAGSRVLLARYSGTDWTLNHAVSGLPAVYRDGSEKIVVALVTLCLGQLVMQFICPADTGETESTSLLTRDDHLFALQIHPQPSEVASWPPTISLGSSDWFQFGLNDQTSVDIQQLLRRVHGRP